MYNSSVQAGRITSGVPNKNSTGVSFQDLYNSNPYSGAEYQVTPWQEFLSALGIRTQADAWRENMGVQAAEFNAQMALKQYDEEYNLPINQVARLRAAGINPDLNGGQGIDPGSAANVADDPSTPMQSTGNEGQLMEFANGVLSCVSMAAGIAGNIENVRGLHLDNQLKELSQESSMSEYALKMFPFLISQTPLDEFDEEGDFLSNASERFLTGAEIFAGPLNKRLRSSFLRNVRAFWNSAPGNSEAKRKWLENVSATKDLAIGSKTNFSWDSGEMEIIADELSKLASKVEKEGLRSVGNESEYNAGYYGDLNPHEAALAENAENKLNRQNFQMVGTLRESLNSIIQRIKKSADSGGRGSVASQALLAALSMFQLYLATQGSPGVRRSSTSGVDAKTGNPYSNRTTTIDF